MAALPEDDFRRRAPAFQEPQLTHNLQLAEKMKAIGARHGRSSTTLALAASLADQIRLLNQDRAMRRAYAELAYTRARERFTTKRMIDQCLELYRSLRKARLEAA